MPLARIDLARGKSAHYRATVGDVVYEATIAASNVPQNDRFQLISEHDDGFVRRDLSRNPENGGLHHHSSDAERRSRGREEARVLKGDRGRTTPAPRRAPRRRFYQPGRS